MTRQEWERSTLAGALAKVPDRRPDAATSSGHVVPIVCTPDDLPGAITPESPPDPPAPRSSRADLPWLEEPVGGATPELANRAIHHVVALGVDGVEVRFDHPTRAGWDADEPGAAAGVGAGGVSASTVADVEDLLAGIDLATVRLSIVGGDVGTVILAFVLAAAERMGVSWAAVRGAAIHDAFGDATPRGDGPPPLAHATRLRSDGLAFCRVHAPAVRPVVVAGGHLRGGGGSAQLELSCVIAAAASHVEAAVHRGVSAEDAGQGVGLAFGTGEFFEEIAKLRAARRLWAAVMRDRFGVTAGDACCPPILVQSSAPTEGTDPWDGVTRSVFRSLAAVLAGADGVGRARGTGVPATASRLSARTVQVLRSESGLAAESDPLRGAWFVERLTQDFVNRASPDLADIDLLVARIGRETRALSTSLEREGPASAGGVLAPRPDSPEPAGAAAVGTADSGRVDDLVQGRIDRVRRWRDSRDAAVARQAAERLRGVVRGDENLMAAVVAAARANLTVGEVCDVLRRA